MDALYGSIRRKKNSFAASVLTAEQLTVMKDLFAECDTNGDGTIDKEELKNTLQKFHRPTETVTDEEVDSLMKQLDPKNRGFIDFDGFVLGFAPILVPDDQPVVLSKEQEEQVRTIFNSLDKDGTGELDVNELKGILLTISTLTSKEISPQQLDIFALQISKKSMNADGFLEVIKHFLATGDFDLRVSKKKEDALSPNGSPTSSFLNNSGEFLDNYRKRMSVYYDSTRPRRDSVFELGPPPSLADVEGEKKALNEQVIRLREEIAHFQEVNNRLVDKISKIKEEKKELKRQLKIAEKMKDTNKQLLEQIEVMKTELEELRKSQKESKKIQQKVNLEKEELSKTLSQKEEELSHSKLELEQVSTHLRTIEKDMKVSSSAVPTAEGKGEYAALMTEYKHYKRTAEENLRSKDDQIEALANEVDKWKKANAETREMLEVANATVTKLKTNLEEQEMENSGVFSKNASFLNELEKEIEQKVSPRDSGKTPTKDRDSKLGSLDFSAISSNQNSVESPKSPKEGARDKEKAELIQSLEEQKALHVQQVEEIKKLQQQVAKMQQERKFLVAENEDLAKAHAENNARKEDPLVPKDKKRRNGGEDERKPLLETAINSEGATAKEEGCCSCCECCVI